MQLGSCTTRHVEDALAWLCERYWLPLYAYVRRSGYDIHEAEDLTQAFFAQLLEKDVLGKASSERGRFRTFLLTAMKNFLANEWNRATAQKRGGRHAWLSLDWKSAESRLLLDPAYHLTPERYFEQQWALRLLDLVASKLALEFAAKGKSRQFELLKEAITEGRSSLPYASLAKELGISEEAARQTASRLKKRYRELLRAEVAETVAEPSDVDAEIRSLFAIFESE